MTETLSGPAGMDEVSFDQLRQLVGLVDYDETSDPFPVRAMDAVVFVVGNATQTAWTRGISGIVALPLLGFTRCRPIR